LTWIEVIERGEANEGAQGGLKFPQPEYITKRLKKIIYPAVRIEYFDFENVQNAERTGLKLDEKQLLIKLLVD